MSGLAIMIAEITDQLCCVTYYQSVYDLRVQDGA